MIWSILVSQWDHKGPHKREAGASELETEDVRVEAEVQGRRCCASGFESKGRSHKPRNAGSL